MLIKQGPVVNADDFGYNDAVNKAIAQCFGDGLINSTSIMAGMPGFEDGIELARSQGFSHAIGVHLNLSEGIPRTDLIRRDATFCNAAGEFRFSLPRTTLRLTPSQTAAVRGELTRQIEICIAAGLKLTHLDSHHHVHNVWPIGRIVIELAQRFRIPAVRVARNIGEGIVLHKHVFKAAFNARLKYHGIARTDLMGNVSDYIAASRPDVRRVELMVHPGLVDGVMLDVTEKKPLEDLMRRAQLF
jgi:chitin disaccharide deacetylase